MDKMQKLECVNDKIRTLKKDSIVLGELCLRIREYVNEERFLPAELHERALYHLKNMKTVQDSCREEYTGLTGVSDLPDTFAEAERRMKKQYELFCKEEIVQSAVRFKRLVTNNPTEAAALKEAQDKTEIVDPSNMTLDRCRERYQPYIDFMEALEENNAGKRIGYVKKLEDIFTPELIAGVIITRDIYDPYEGEEVFDEVDLDDYDVSSNDIVAVTSYLPSDYSDDADAEIEELEETALEEAVEASLEEVEKAEEAAEAAEACEEAVEEEEEEAEEEAEEEIEEAAESEAYEEAVEEAEAYEEVAEEAEAYEEAAEEAETAEEAAVEEEETPEVIPLAAEPAAEEVPERAAEAEETEEAGEPAEETEAVPEVPGETAEAQENDKDYLEDFDKEYVTYYRLAAERIDAADGGKLAPWPKIGETFGEGGVRNVLNSLGFHVDKIEEQDRIRGKYENYNVILDEADGVLTGSEPAPLANFRREACEEGFRVACLYGTFSGEGFSRAFREIGNRHHTLILFEESVTQGVRRSLVRLVRKEGQSKEFALLDRVAYTYLEQNYEADKINQMFLDIIMPGPATK